MKPMSLAAAFRRISGLTGLSRILGFLRDIAFAAFLGAGPAADAFLVALKLPNMFRRLTAILNVNMTCQFFRILLTVSMSNMMSS